MQIKIHINACFLVSLDDVVIVAFYLSLSPFLSPICEYTWHNASVSLISSTFCVACWWLFCCCLLLPLCFYMASFHLQKVITHRWRINTLQNNRNTHTHTHTNTHVRTDLPRQAGWGRGGLESSTLYGRLQQVAAAVRK